MAIATDFNDFIVVPFWETWWFTSLLAVSLLTGVAGTVRIVEKKKYQLQLQRAEQERALERERARIAQDLHDDLGSSLTRISLISGLLMADRNNPDQVAAHVSKLSSSADHAVRALEEIVWAVRPGSDTLQGLVEYIAHVGNEMFESNSTRCRLDLPAELPAIPLPPELRHNVFLVVKEALTNVLKHANAREVHVQAQAAAGSIEIVVQDDGVGFDSGGAEWRSGNGMGNMRRRAQAIGGAFAVDSQKGQGTVIRLGFPLPTVPVNGKAALV